MKYILTYTITVNNKTSSQFRIYDKFDVAKKDCQELMTNNFKVISFDRIELFIAEKVI